MPALRTLFRLPRPAAAPVAPAAPPETGTPRVFRVDEAEALYPRDPHGMLRMDPATAEAYIAAMSG